LIWNSSDRNSHSPRYAFPNPFVWSISFPGIRNS